MLNPYTSFHLCIFSIVPFAEMMFSLVIFHSVSFHYSSFIPLATYISIPTFPILSICPFPSPPFHFYPSFHPCPPVPFKLSFPLLHHSSHSHTSSHLTIVLPCTHSPLPFTHSFPPFHYSLCSMSPFHSPTPFPSLPSHSFPFSHHSLCIPFPLYTSLASIPSPLQLTISSPAP